MCINHIHMNQNIFQQTYKKKYFNKKITEIMENKLIWVYVTWEMVRYV